MGGSSDEKSAGGGDRSEPGAGEEATGTAGSADPNGRTADADRPSICVVTHPLSTAGEPSAAGLLDILTAVCASLTVVTARLPEDSAIRGQYDLVELDSNREMRQRTIVGDAIGFVRNQLRMTEVVARTDADAVLFFGAVSYVLPILVSRLRGKRTIVEPRGDVPLTLRLVWSRRISSPFAQVLAAPVWLLERVGYQLATDIVLYTPAMQAQLGLERHAAKTHPRGARYVDIDRFHPDGDFDDRERRVGYVGRLDEEKGIPELADAAATLAERDVAFTFVGDGTLSGWLAERLVEEIAAGDVELAGWVDHDEVPDQLRRLRLLVMASSPTEGLPMTALEAMACGTPVCAPPVAGLADVLWDGETGVRLEELSGEAVATAVDEALASGDLPEMSRRCVDLVETEFIYDAAVERYERILN